MAEILHQLRLVVSPIIYRVLAPCQAVVWDVLHQQYVRASPMFKGHVFCASQVDLMLDTNLSATIKLTRQFLKIMLEAMGHF